MPDSLVTVASYTTPVEAALVKNQLELAGVPAFLTNDAMVTMAWQYSNATGGVGVQVAASDAAQAREILEELRASLATENLGSGSAGTTHNDENAAEEDRWTAASPREAAAQRALRAAMLGLLFPPLWIATLWLLAKVLASRERLGSQYAWQAWAAAAVVVPVALGFAMILGISALEF
jgi:hypothetical protein